MDNVFERVSGRIAVATGRPLAFVCAAAVIVVWAVSGPLFHYSDTWQLVINTGTTIVTFLMVFLIQNAHSRDTRAMNLKLDELIRVNEMAFKHLITAENLSEAELQALTILARRLPVTPWPSPGWAPQAWPPFATPTTHPRSQQMQEYLREKTFDNKHTVL